MVLRERECLERLIASEDAWSEFWQLYGKAISFEVYSFSRYSELSFDDVCQKLVLKLLDHDYKILRSHLLYPKRSSFISLLRKIVRNLLIDEYRKLKSRAKIELSNGELQFLDHFSSVSENESNHSRLTERVTCLFKSVTKRSRDTAGFKILCLRYIDGENVNTIAEVLKMKPNTVSHRIGFYLNIIRENHMDEIRELANEQ